MEKRGPGRPRKSGPIFFGEQMEDCLKWMQTRPRKRCKESSVKAARIRLGHMQTFLPDGENFDLRGITDDYVRDYVEHRENEDGVSGRTVNSELIAFGSLLRYTERVAKLWDSPPVRVVDFMFDETRLGKPEITVLSEAEVRHLLRVAATQATSGGAPPARTTLVIALAYFTGLRHAEISHLWCRDVNLMARELNVSKKPTWVPKDYEARPVPIHQDLSSILQNYLSGLSDSRPEAWLFPGYGVRCMNNFSVEVKESFQHAGLGDPKRRPGLHMLRRTWATNLLAGGRSLTEVMELGGWSTITSVQRYLTSSKASHRSAIAALPSVFGSGQPELKSGPAPAADGFDPDEVRELRKRGFTLAEALEFLEKMR